jgi:hypothetical protein
MNTLEKKQTFVREFFASMQKHIESKLEHMPDGHELREYIALEFAQERTEALKNKRGRRYRDFRNALYTKPL